MAKKTNDNLAKLQSLFIKPEEAVKYERKLPSIEKQNLNQSVWIDIQDATKSSLIEATSNLDILEIHLHQSLTKGLITKITSEKKYIFLVLHFPYLNSTRTRILANQVSFFISKDYLLTIHDSTNSNIRDIFIEYGTNSETKVKSPGRILFQIIENLLQNVSELTQEIYKNLDKLEASVFDTTESDAFKIGQARQKIMRLRRTMGAQKVVLEELEAKIDSISNEHLARYYEKNTHQSQRLWDLVEEAKETIEIYKDADFTASTEKTNEILAILTLIFTFTIPPSVIGTFYGMNIRLPGGIEVGSWDFFGTYTTLIMICLVSSIPVMLMAWYFRKKRWF